MTQATNMPLDLDSRGVKVLPFAVSYTQLRKGDPSVIPCDFDVVNPRVVTMKSRNGTPVGEFIGAGAEENATRLCAMLRLCDGIGTDVLHRLRVKLADILDEKGL